MNFSAVSKVRKVSERTETIDDESPVLLKTNGVICARCGLGGEEGYILMRNDVLITIGFEATSTTKYTPLCMKCGVIVCVDQAMSDGTQKLVAWCRRFTNKTKQLP